MTIYDSYNAKCAARTLKRIERGKILNAYSATHRMKFDTSNDMQKHILWM